MKPQESNTERGPADPAFTERVRLALETLEAIVADRGLLADLQSEDYTRLMNAVELVYHPDLIARRRLVKATIKRRKAERVQQQEDVLKVVRKYLGGGPKA